MLTLRYRMITQALRNCKFGLVTLLVFFAIESQGQSQPFTKEYVKNGVFKLTFFHDNGTIEQEGYIKNNQNFGYWKAYDTNGNLTAEAWYGENGKEGPWRFYNEDGQEFGKLRYEDNLLVSASGF